MQLPCTNCMSSMAEDDSNQLLNPYYAEVPMLRTGHAKLRPCMINICMACCTYADAQDTRVGHAWWTFEGVQEETHSEDDL